MDTADRTSDVRSDDASGIAAGCQKSGFVNAGDHDPRIPFRIRIRETERLFDGEQSINGKRLFEGLKMGEHRILKRERRLWGHWVQVAALKLLDGELMIIVTQQSVETAIVDYGKR